MYDFDKHLAALSEQTVLCIGDLMLDEFVYGEVSRISPEAPTPVIAVKRSEVMIGGAGNVARNLVGLGARCIFVGAVGDDDAGGAFTKALGSHPLIEFHLVVDGSRQTTRKVRFVSEHHSTHLLRADWETPSAVSASSEDALIDHAIKAMPKAGAVVLSDYAKGALTPRVIRAVIDAANERKKPVVVDPKGRDYSIYRGATLVTPNRQELADATHSAARTDEEIADAATKLCDALAAKAVLVTRSEAGMTLVSDGSSVHIPAYPVRVRDVSGAGDTVVAVLSAMLAIGADFSRLCALRMRQGQSWSASVEPQRSLFQSCVHAYCRPRPWRRKRRSPSTGLYLTTISPNGASKACASDLPTAASICFTPVTSSFSPGRAPRATAWLWV